jgi:glyoxylase-like metal-dependent hydrolase (beta-lactamase superfamily II)
MKVPLEVVRIPILPFGLVNAHLVLGNEGAIVVDAGLPDTQDVVEQALRGRNLAWSDIKLIVITHAHTDHAGNAGWIRALTGAPVSGHQGDLDHYRQHKRMSVAFLPIMASQTAVLKVGLVTATVRTCADGDWLLTLHSCPLAPG